jgi:MtN3 and saliva related transmembrane protein
MVYNFITQAIIIEVTGFVAGILGAIAILPQVIKAWKSKSTNDISAPWVFVALLSLILWIIYGWGISSYPLIIMSSLEALLMVFLLVLKMMNDRKN